MKQERWLTLAAAVVPLLGNGLAVAIWLPLLGLPPGTPIRPMLETGQSVAVAGLTLLAGVPFGPALRVPAGAWPAGSACCSVARLSLSVC